MFVLSGFTDEQTQLFFWHAWFFFDIFVVFKDSFECLPDFRYFFLRKECFKHISDPP
ncbi:hypothetical protein LRU_00504 [Ligilactobacillus ruminis SPM0211]|uniref:Uncharacterized protein n=1 Tax=Ligilactobacillus ruminis SPM0211 TaxID=1040964 RepID=F7QYL5_9LACO|nr:hypothetical protein LRU_00504 [Ligilactobacillus ruminis SPM0211]